MPSRFNSENKYTTIPIALYEILSHTRLTPIESMILNHIIHQSLNIFRKKDTNQRQWVEFQTGQFANDRGLTRQAVQKSILRLVSFGLIKSREKRTKTNSGYQLGREFLLANNQELNQILDHLTSTNKSQGANHQLAPKKAKIIIGANQELAPGQPPVGTLTTTSWHLDNHWLAPSTTKDIESLKNLIPKDFKKTFKYFLKTVGEFQNSFYELYTSEISSGAKRFRIEMQMSRLIRHYGLLNCYIGMFAHLFEQPSNSVDFDALERSIKHNIEKSKQVEEKFQKLSYFILEAMQKISLEIEIDDLEIFKENFRFKVNLFLTKISIDNRDYFIYKSQVQNIINTYETSFNNPQRFHIELKKHFELYLKSKILGIKGLNFDQE